MKRCSLNGTHPIHLKERQECPTLGKTRDNGTRRGVLMISLASKNHTKDSSLMIHNGVSNDYSPTLLYTIDQRYRFSLKWEESCIDLGNMHRDSSTADTATVLIVQFSKLIC